MLKKKKRDKSNLIKSLKRKMIMKRKKLLKLRRRKRPLKEQAKK